jgi:transcriptional regulator with XRE-family HTH domain
LPRRTAADPIALAFGQAIRDTRLDQGLTLEDVARRIPRLDPRYLGEIELGWHATSIVRAKQIADALGVPLTDLVRDL